MSNWAENNKLVLNVSKQRVLFLVQITHARSELLPSISMNVITVELVHELKLLGVIQDEDWSQNGKSRVCYQEVFLFPD